MANPADARVEINHVVADASLGFQHTVQRACEEILEELVTEHTKQVDALAAAIEQLHRTAHGNDHGLRVCPHEPCASVWKHLPAPGEAGTL